MKLYLISQDASMLAHWQEAFVAHQPCITEAIPSLFESESLYFIHDVLLEAMNESDLNVLLTSQVMVLSMTPSFERSGYFLKRGARGYGNAMMHATHLLWAHQSILEGNVWLIPEYISRLIWGLPVSVSSKVDTLSQLSEREKEVALLLSAGDSHKDIADKLDITVRTVKAHATSIYHKLEIKDRLCLALLLR